MDLISGIFWIFLIWAFLWPQLRYQFLQNERYSLIKKLEKKNNSRVILLVHRQEQIGLFGIPFVRFINIEDSEAVLRAIRTTPPNTPIDLVLHTPGGLVLAAVQIALALKAHPSRTRVIIPHYAMSGGTLIALAADEIIMDPHAILGPVDPQLNLPDKGVLPVSSIVKVAREKGREASDTVLIHADVAEKAIKQVENIVFRLLEGKYTEDKARELAHILSTGKWTHDYPITYEEARKLGLHVRSEVPEEVYDLMELYPQAQQPQRPSVEFIPYRKEGKNEF
jgi:ClpP class serine protease